MFKKGSSGNPEGRPHGAKNKRTLIRDALNQIYDDGEAGFWLAVAEKAQAGDFNAIGMIGARLVPPLRATDTPVVLEGLDDGSLTEKAEKIIGHMGKGDVSPSEATAMINAIAGLCRVQEVEYLSKRIEALERTLKKR